MSNKLLAGTSKGLIILTNNTGKWMIEEVQFEGLSISLLYVDQRNNTWWAGISHRHWGEKLHFSHDEGKNWQEKEVYRGIDKFGAFPLTLRGDNHGHLYCGASSFPQDPEKGPVSGRKAEILEWIWN